jgi:hypothetical protein
LSGAGFPHIPGPFDGFHALLPVTGCLAIEVVSLKWRSMRVIPDWTLPDLCSPHISLEDRYDSWSHTVLFLVILLPVCAGMTW